MKYNTYYLTFITPLHIGDYKPDSYESSESYLRSDTIIAAILSAWAKSGQEEWIGDGDPGFTVSSAFPFYGIENNEVRFFPRIKLPFNLSDSDSSLSKAIKKITWMDQHHFEKVISKEEHDATFNDHIKGEFITSALDFDKEFMTKQISERVAIPRERSEDKQSEPFYMERLYFNNGGLYFFASGEHIDRLEAALNFLQYEGFGTDRNIGNGFFTWHKTDTEINVPTGAEYSVNLGLFCPQNKDDVASMVDKNAAYDFIKRGGWITKDGHHGIEKNSIYMFTEGSIFKAQKPIDGNPNIDLTPSHLPNEMLPDHKIYRNGRSLFIPVKI